MAIKFPPISEPAADVVSLVQTVRQIMQFLNILTENERGVALHQFFERGSSSDGRTLRDEFEALRREFNEYKRLHP